MTTLRLGTRGSALARAQAGQVARALEGCHPGLAVELVLIHTSGDHMTSGPLAAVGGKGLFVKEIEEALRAGTIDCAVHSMKDVPARLAAGCVIAAVPARAEAHDVLIGGGGGLAGLPERARVGTASVRRRAQLLARRRDLVITPARGNVDTRLAKWRRGEFDGIVLAAAGLARLGLVVPEARAIPPEEVLPAVGQGALALEAREDDVRTCGILSALADGTTAAAVAAERGFLIGIGGDCNSSVAAYGTVADGRVTLRALVTDAEGTRRLEDAGTEPVGEAEALGRALAERLLGRGAARLLRE